MRKAPFIRSLVVLAMLACTLLLAGTALADEVSVVEYRLYEDGSTVSVSYAQEVDGNGYMLKGYMTLKDWSFVMDPSGGPAGMSESEIISAWEAGMREWNSHLESSIFTMDNSQASVGPLNLETQLGTYDRRNTISFQKLDSGVLALTRAYVHKDLLPDGYPVQKRVVEVDIVFDTTVDWGDVEKGHTGHDMCAIATHELGHTLGMGDVSDSAYSYVTMYGYGMAGDSSPRTLAEPDLVGLSKLYEVPGYGGPGPLPPLPTPTPTPTAQITAIVHTSSGGLNMRAEPSTTGAWVTTIPRDETVIVLEKGDVWSKVSYGDYTGYVKNDYLIFNDPDAEPTPTPTTRDAIVNTGSRLNMRRSPSTDSAIVTKIPAGAKVKVTGQTGDWSSVIYGNYAGYVMTQYLTFVGTGETETPGPGETETPTPTMRDAVVNASTRLNMRKSPSTSSDIVTKIPAGAVVKVISHASDWSKVMYNGYTGYVVSQYITLKETETTPPQETETTPPQETETTPPQETETTPPQETETTPPTTPDTGDDAEYRTVTLGSSTKKLNMRSGAGSDYELVAQVPSGTKVELLAEDGEWSRIKYGDITGYVMSRYLK